MEKRSRKAKVLVQLKELDSQITTRMDSASEEPTAKVASLFIYPVKSCRGIQVPQAPLTRTGFRWDRNWLVVNGKGRGYTQRVEPKLALVQVELPSEAFDESWEPTKDSFMVLNAPGMQPLKICMNKHDEVVDGVSLWEWSGSAWYEGDEAAQWFTDFLGKPSSLIRFNIDSQARLAAPQFYHNSELTCFSDGYQFLVISQGSMDVINQHASEPIPINRFRPNFLVEGCEPFSEDLWKKIKIGKFSFDISRLCFRCKVPQVNQETGIAGREPAQTLQKIRSDKILRPNGAPNKNLTYVGQFIAWSKEETAASGKGKIIKVGDPIYVLERVNSFNDAIA